MRDPADPVSGNPAAPSTDGSPGEPTGAALADLFADFDGGLAAGLAIPAEAAAAASTAPVADVDKPAASTSASAIAWVGTDVDSAAAEPGQAADAEADADAPPVQASPVASPPVSVEAAVVAAATAEASASMATAPPGLATAPPVRRPARPSPALPRGPRGPRVDPLIEVAQAPHRHDFLHVLRRVDAHHRDKPRLGTARRPVDEPVRLGQAADLSFAPSELSAVSLQDRSGKPRIEVRFFGLFGPNGPLPLHLTAYARERRMHKADETFGRFADLFHHRLLLLFYRAWAQAQPTASLDRPDDDRFADYVGSMIGVGGPAWRKRDAAPDHARLAFAGLLSRQVRHADGLAHLLSGYLGMAVRVEQFVGRWMPLPAAERTRIGRRAASRRQSTSQLGVSAVLGQAVFDRQHHFRVHVGPLSLQAFEALLPVGQALPAVQALLKHYVGLEFGWDLRLELARNQVPACRPGRYGRLGWTSWLGQPPPGQPAALNLVPNPLTS